MSITMEHEITIEFEYSQLIAPITLKIQLPTTYEVIKSFYYKLAHYQELEEFNRLIFYQDSKVLEDKDIIDEKCTLIKVKDPEIQKISRIIVYIKNY